MDHAAPPDRLHAPGPLARTEISVRLIIALEVFLQKTASGTVCRPPASSAEGHHHAQDLIAASALLAAPAPCPNAPLPAPSAPRTHRGKTGRTDLPQLLPRRQPEVLDDPPRADDAMRLCSQYRDIRRAKCARRSNLAQKATIRYPVDGKLIGDWKEGEKLASSGRGGHIGFIQPDPPGRLRGGNCYACHQLARRKSPTAPSAPACSISASCAAIRRRHHQVRLRQDLQLQRLHACSNMPRFGLQQLTARADHPPRRLPVDPGIAENN